MRRSLCMRMSTLAKRFQLTMIMGACLDDTARLLQYGQRVGGSIGRTTEGEGD